jgi:hypothetical protein
MKASMIIWRYYRAARGQLNAVLDEEAQPGSGPHDNARKFEGEARKMKEATN